MKTLHFKCELKTNIIITERSASEGQQTTLDYIPGSNFLGIVARNVYPNPDISPETKLDLFHNGKVRFGDAHVSKDGIRTLKTPACVFYPKLKKITDEAYIHYLVPDLTSEEMREKQLKQARSGFYIFKGDEAEEVNTGKSFAIKSAHDKKKRTSEKEKMYGYQSLRRGMTLLFTVEVENDELCKMVTDNLTGVKNIGRSKTAEYGQVKISLADFKEEASHGGPVTVNVKDLATGKTEEKKCVIVYAESRLVFFDAYGQPTAQPTGEDLGVNGGQVVWSLTQVRTFQYSPFNFKRHAYDATLFGIEKGSVLVVEAPEGFQLPDDNTVGCYTFEGFGKVIYNPSFLEANEEVEEKGKGKCKVQFKEAEKDNKHTEKTIVDSPLFKYLQNRQEHEKAINEIYKRVNDFADKKKSIFKSNRTFKSQWGEIRSLAMAAESYQDLYAKLFKEHKDKKLSGYLMHGVAKDDWNERGRIDKLKKFINGLLVKDEPDGIDLTNYWKEAVVNLASQMAKTE